MKVGKLVKLYIGMILEHCEKSDVSELSRLMDKAYSKRHFNINFPFFTETSQLLPFQLPRYWKDEYQIQGKNVRVCCEWFVNDKEYFKRYLLKHQLVSQIELDTRDNKPEAVMETASVEDIRTGRYKGNHIGNAQNLLVRNILSNLGEESFNEDDWNKTKEHFLNYCAYCGDSRKLLMEHAIPINRKSLGEHRLGNIVPSCESCNKAKGAKDFREFLGDDEDRVLKIEEYMASRNYVPLEKDNEQIEKILEMARLDILAVANRYTTLLNELFIDEA